MSLHWEDSGKPYLVVSFASRRLFAMRGRGANAIVDESRSANARAQCTALLSMPPRGGGSGGGCSRHNCALRAPQNSCRLASSQVTRQNAGAGVASFRDTGHLHDGVTQGPKT